VRGGNATGLTIDDRKTIAVKHVTVRYYSPSDDFSLNSSFTNSQLSHEFTTFLRIHDFCMSSYVDFSGFHDFRTNSRLLHDFTTHTTK
jgi:hypothetical protein